MNTPNPAPPDPGAVALSVLKAVREHERDATAVVFGNKEVPAIADEHDCTIRDVVLEIVRLREDGFIRGEILHRLLKHPVVRDCRLTVSGMRAIDDYFPGV